MCFRAQNKAKQSLCVKCIFCIACVTSIFCLRSLMFMQIGWLSSVPHLYQYVCVCVCVHEEKASERGRAVFPCVSALCVCLSTAQRMPP